MLLNNLVKVLCSQPIEELIENLNFTLTFHKKL